MRKRRALVDFDDDLIAGDFRGFFGGDNYWAAQLLKALGAFVIRLAKASVEAALGEFLEDASLACGDFSEDLKGQDAIVEGHPTGLVAAGGKREHGALGRVDQVANGLGGFVAEFAG